MLVTEEVMKMTIAAGKGHQRDIDALPLGRPRSKRCEGHSPQWKADGPGAPASPESSVTTIVVNLGSPHSASHRSPMEYISSPLTDADGSLSLEISISNNRRDRYFIDIPVLEDLAGQQVSDVSLVLDVAL